MPKASSHRGAEGSRQRKSKLPGDPGHTCLRFGSSPRGVMVMAPFPPVVGGLVPQGLGLETVLINKIDKINACNLMGASLG